MSGIIAALGSKLWTPISFLGCLLWLDGSDASTYTIGTGLSQWRDKSGNANHANQSTGSAQPTVQAADQNGLNTVKFVSASSQFFSLTNAITPVNYTVAVVLKKTSGNDLTPIGGSNSYGLLSYSDETIYFIDGSGGNKVSHSGALSLASYASMISVGTGVLATDAFYYNGTSESLVNIASGQAVGTWNLIGEGNIFASDGYIGELIMYNSALSAAQTARLYSYLKNKWGTP
jgi:hypothetical protein